MPCFRPQETFNLFSIFLHHTTHVPPPGKSTPHQSPRRCQCVHRVLTLYGIATRETKPRSPMNTQISVGKGVKEKERGNKRVELDVPGSHFDGASEFPAASPCRLIENRTWSFLLVLPAMRLLSLHLRIAAVRCLETSRGITSAEKNHAMNLGILRALRVAIPRAFRLLRSKRNHSEIRPWEAEVSYSVGSWMEWALLL